jgi:hypothetical protein
MHPGLACDHLRYSGHGWLLCVRCGATCSRNNEGRIVKFDRDAKGVK